MEESVGLCVLPLLSHKQNEESEHLTFVPRTGWVGEGAGREECGEREGNSRVAKTSTGSGADEEMKSPTSTLLYPGSDRDLWRAAEPALFPWNELGKMRLGKSKYLSNLFKVIRPLFLSHGLLGFSSGERMPSLSQLLGFCFWEANMIPSHLGGVTDVVCRSPCQDVSPHHSLQLCTKHATQGSLWHFKGAVSCSQPISKATELSGCASAVNWAHSLQVLTTELIKSVIHIVIYRVWCFLQGASTPSTSWSPSWCSEGEYFVSISLHLWNCL